MPCTPSGARSMTEPILRELATPEMRLLLAAACCEQGDSSTHERVRREAAALGDWARLQHVARAHRMLPFVVDAVAWSGVQVPAPTMQSLLHERLEIAAGAWRAVHETAALHRRLTDAGVRALVYKGPLLSQRAYGDCTMRASIDIDLVVERAQLARATDVLRGAGYGLRADATLRGATVIYAAYAQLPFGHLEDPVARDVDLHWRFSNRTLPWNPPLRDLLEAAEPLSIAGVALPIVPLEHELLLQLLHGARHHWRTLEWLLVVRALLRDRSLDANGLLELSRDHVHGCRAVLTGCALAHLLLDTPLPRAIADAVEADRAAGSLASELARAIVASNELIPRSRRWLLRTQDSVWDQARLLAVAAAVPTPREAEWIRLPRGATALYWPLRWIRLVLRAVGLASSPTGSGPVRR